VNEKPNTRYQMLWRGEMRPITQLFRGQQIVHDPMMATVAVLYVGDGWADNGWVVERVTPGEVIEVPRNERSRYGRVWDNLD
jgi:hypothetical protein